MRLGPLQARVSGSTWGAAPPDLEKHQRAMGLLRPWKGPSGWRGGGSAARAYLVEELRLQSCPLGKHVLARTLGRRPGRGWGAGDPWSLQEWMVELSVSHLGGQGRGQKWLRRPSRSLGSL